MLNRQNHQESWVKRGSQTQGVDNYYVTNSTNAILTYKDKRLKMPI